MALIQPNHFGFSYAFMTERLLYNRGITSRIKYSNNGVTATRHQLVALWTPINGLNQFRVLIVFCKKTY